MSAQDNKDDSPADSVCEHLPLNELVSSGKYQSQHHASISSSMRPSSTATATSHIERLIQVSMPRNQDRRSDLSLDCQAEGVAHAGNRKLEDHYSTSSSSSELTATSEGQYEGLICVTIAVQLRHRLRTFVKDAFEQAPQGLKNKLLDELEVSIATISETMALRWHQYYIDIIDKKATEDDIDKEAQSGLFSGSDRELEYFIRSVLGQKKE